MPNLHDSNAQTTDLLPAYVAEVDIETGVEVGFIIATTCTSLELEEDDDLLEEASNAADDESSEK